MNKIIRLINNFFKKVQCQYRKYQEMQRIEDRKITGLPGTNRKVEKQPMLSAMFPS